MLHAVAHEAPTVAAALLGAVCKARNADAAMVNRGSGRTAFMTAASRGNAAAVRLLVDRLSATLHGDAWQQHLMLQDQVSVYGYGQPKPALVTPHVCALYHRQDGLTALMHAAAAGATECVELVLGSCEGPARLTLITCTNKVECST